jgi:predicted RNase H-like nuclease
MLFVGIDLAWSEKNGSGIAALDGSIGSGRFVSGDVVFSDEEIVGLVKKKTKGRKALVAIDAPLIVPNEDGRRIAEELVEILFRKYDAGAHPANRRRLSQWSGKVRGEEIVGLLEKEEFKHDPYVGRFEETRKLFEVYPHPSMVVLFKLSKVLQYKAKPKRNYNSRWEEFQKYQNHLKNLREAKPSLVLPKEITERDIRRLKGQELKNYEDLLDAIFCAYIAYYYWANPDKCLVLGDMERGYIMTPVFDFMRKRLDGIASQKNLTDF